MTQVTRWTGVVTTSDAGGFVAYGDYLALQAENERLKEINQTYINYFNTWAQEVKNEQRLSFRTERDALKAKLDALQTQEPVGVFDFAVNEETAAIRYEYEKHKLASGTKLYAAPKALEPLTDEQIDAIMPQPSEFGMHQPPWSGSDLKILRAMSRATEAAHGITKGTP